jgi:hypothetical protein
MPLTKTGRCNCCGCKCNPKRYFAPGHNSEKRNCYANQLPRDGGKDGTRLISPYQWEAMERKKKKETRLREAAAAETVPTVLGMKLAAALANTVSA